MIGIQERKEKTDGNRIDAFFLEPHDRLPWCAHVDRLERIAAKIDSLGNFLGVIGRCKQARLFEEQVVGGRSIAAGLFHDFVNASEALGHEKSGLGAFLFQERIGPDSGAVAKKWNIAGRHAPVDELFDAVQDGLKGLLRSRRNLGDRDFSCVFVKKHKVGKCSARINCHSVLRHSFFRLSLKFRRFNSAAPLKNDNPRAINFKLRWILGVNLHNRPRLRDQDWSRFAQHSRGGDPKLVRLASLRLRVATPHWLRHCRCGACQRNPEVQIGAGESSSKPRSEIIWCASDAACPGVVR